MEKVQLKTASDDAFDLKALLQQTHNEALGQNENATAHWIKIRDEHMALYSHLETLPDKLSHEVMVPVGSKALMRGKMVHTNEIMVCLGDGWFVKRSAKEAAEICNRRIKVCEGMLKDLERERDLLSSRKELPLEQDAFGAESRQEINEPYDEKEETKWRDQHRQKEKEYRHKLAELRKSQSTQIENEGSLWKRLDELELQEELEEELDRLHAEMEERGYGDEGEDYEEEEEEEDDGDNDDNTNESKTDQLTNTDHERDSKNPSQELDKPYSVDDSTVIQTNKRPQSPPYRKKSSASGDNESQHPKNEGRRVSFADEQPPNINNGPDLDDEPFRIEFHHTPTEPNLQYTKCDNNQPMQSPADIYKFIKEQVSCANKPKSILKRRSGDLGTPNESCIPVKDSYLEESASLAMQLQEEVEERPLVVGDVVEHISESAPGPSEQPSQDRPVSKFRASRKANKRTCLQTAEDGDKSSPKYVLKLSLKQSTTSF